MNLLAAIYDLPKLGLLCPFDRDQASKLGSRWIVFHHFPPSPELIDWLEEAQPNLLTTVRHPGDVLLSLYHHLRGFSSEPVNLQELRKMLHDPFERCDIWPPAVHTFREELNCSLQWKRTGLTRVVRYEDLRLNTMETLVKLTEWIGSVPRECIEQAIERCDINLMRQLAGKHGAFFRSGKTGEWRHVVSPEIIQDLQAPPYFEQVQELGYSLDVDEPSVAAALPVTTKNPFNDMKVFDNGAVITPIVIDFYLSLDPSRNRKWPALASGGSGSYCEWLCQETACRGSGVYKGIKISNLAYFLYQVRTDLQRRFPDLSGRDRADYCQWVIRNQETDFSADPSLLESMKTSYWTWGTARPASDQERRPWWPILTNFALHVYHSKPELSRAFPDVYNLDRWNFLEWMIRADNELETFPEFIVPIRDNLRKTAKIRALLELIPVNLPRLLGNLQRLRR